MTWRTHLAPLFARSRLLRSLVLVVLTVAMASTWALGMLQALDLSGEQRAQEALGASTGAILPAEEIAGPGTYPPVPSWTDGVDIVLVSGTQLSLVDASDALLDVHYEELPFPSAPLEGRVQLDDGRWPRAAGECVGTSTSPTLRAPTGRWELTLVGHAHLVFAPEDSGIWCAVGTWERYHAADGEADGPGIQTSVHLLGSPEQAEELTQRLVDDGTVSPYSVLLRSAVVSMARTSPQEFLAIWVVSMVLLVAVPMIFAGRLARWVGSVEHSLVLAGVPSASVRRAALLAAGVATAAAATIGAALGTLGALATRPVLRAWASGRPLGPWAVDVPTTLMAIGGSTGGALVGFGFGVWRTRAVRRRAVREARPLSERGRRGLAASALLLTLVALGVLWTSEGRLWAIAGGVVLGIAAGAVVAPLFGLLLARRLASGRGTPAALAGRIIVEDGRRWSAVLVGATCFLGAVVAIFINMSASIAAQGALLQPPVPPGMVVVDVPEAQQGEDPTASVRRMEQDLGLTHSAELLQTELMVGDEGVLFLLPDRTSATAVLGPLDADAERGLAEGAILRPGGSAGEVTVQSATGDAALRMRVQPYRPDPAHHVTLGYGFVMQEAIDGGAARAGARRAWVYTGVDDQTSAALREWPARSGNLDVVVHAHHDHGGASMPLRLTAGFGVLALLAVPLLVWSMRREIDALRPLVLALDSLGVPRRWATTVLLTIASVQVVVPLVVGVLVAVTTTGLLQVLYPPLFDTMRANWLGVAVVAVVLALSVWASARWATVHLRRRVRQDLI